MICEKFVSLQEDFDPPQEQDIEHKMQKYKEKIQLPDPNDGYYKFLEERAYPAVSNEEGRAASAHLQGSILDGEVGQQLRGLLGKALETIEDEVYSPQHLKGMVKQELVKNM